MSAGPKACVVGWPAAHSRSPMIHGHWLRTYGIAGSYDFAEIPPDGFDAFVTSLADRGYVGCNVTVPHKEAAYRRLDAAEPASRRLGVANTLWLAGARLHGDNTDVQGFLANLDAEAPGWDRGVDSALVLGAGGAARSVVYGLLDRGARHVRVVNRTAARCADLLRLFDARVSSHGWDELPELLGASDLLVNSTSLGMIGKPPLELDLGALKPGALVTDIVYVPLETPLLAEARRRGHPAVGGLGMLLHQAVPGFERWFGVRPEVTPALYRLVVDDLLAR